MSVAGQEAPPNGLIQQRAVPRVALTIDEAAVALGISRDHLERHVLPDLRVIRVGRRLLVRIAELERWAQRNEAVGA
jgi:excisionase family DNA binding protein